VCVCVCVCVRACVCVCRYICLFIVVTPWHISQNWYTWVAEKTSICNSPSLLVNAAGTSIGIFPKAGSKRDNKDQALIRWPQRLPDLTPCGFLLWGYVKDSFYRLYYKIWLSCEEESSLPSQKSVVTCCSGYERLSAWRLPFHKGRTHTALMRHAKKNCSFSFHLYIACYNPSRHSSVQTL